MDWRSRPIAVDIVTNENMITVWTTSPHLAPRFMRLAGPNNAVIHWKNRTIIIPRVRERSVLVSTNG